MLAREKRRQNIATRKQKSRAFVKRKKNNSWTSIISSKFEYDKVVVNAHIYTEEW